MDPIGSDCRCCSSDIVVGRRPSTIGACECLVANHGSKVEIYCDFGCSVWIGICGIRLHLAGIGVELAVIIVTTCGEAKWKRKAKRSKNSSLGSVTIAVAAKAAPRRTCG